MRDFNPLILPRIESLLQKTTSLGGFAEANAAACLEALGRAVAQKSVIFGIEPWHALHDGLALDHPCEFLLRLKNEKGEALPPYPAIMAFYNHELAAEIDVVLVLCALEQFREGDEKQVSINLSGRSLRDAEFLKTILPAIESMALGPQQKIIFEIHESAPSEIMSQRVLDLCRKLGIAFAIDDVGLSMNDILRLSEFERIADFIKLDRKSVNAEPQSTNSLGHLMALLGATLPNVQIVAEGVQSAGHAAELLRQNPGIHYVQGMHLPGREEFAREWNSLRKAA